MIRPALLVLTAVNLSFFAWAQVPKKRLPQNINVPTYSHIFPSLSGDGMQMFYLTDYTNSEGFEMKYTQKIGSEMWADPETVPQINRVGLDHIGSFCLSYDGNFVVFSSRRSPGVGKYDIWFSEKKGNSWSTPQNPGKPLNSPSNEGNPSLSPDGKSVYFMRCETMDNLKKGNCSLYVSHRISDRTWSEPQLLPPSINTGHETTPRIMVDNKTLIFASGRPGGKGKLDLYSTVVEDDSWSDPVPLAFINTKENDEYVSVPARGDLMYFTGPYRDNLNIYKAIIPEQYRPNKVLMLAGTVVYTDGQNPVDDILIQAFDVGTGEVFTTTKLKQDDGSFTLFLPEGKTYDVSAFPIKGGHAYYGEIVDLEDMDASGREDLSVNLDPVQPNLIIPLSTIRFEPNTAILTNESDTEVKRIIGFLKKNPGIKLEIGAYVREVLTDSVFSEGLTNIMADTTFITIPKQDSTMRSEEYLAGDTADFVNQENETDELDSLLSVLNETDTVAIISLQDSVRAAGYEFFESTYTEDTYYKITYTYHNDLTEEQSKALTDTLIKKGVPSNLLEAKGYGDDWTTDRSTEYIDYWIELKILDN